MITLAKYLQLYFKYSFLPFLLPPKKQDICNFLFFHFLATLLYNKIYFLKFFTEVIHLKYKLFSNLLLFSIILLAACSTTNDDVPATIEAKPDTGYGKTFQELRIGNLLNFDFQLNNADQTWVTIWVESYQDGKQKEQSAAQLAYGLSPNKTEQGPLGIGMFETVDGSYLFIYSNNSSLKPTKIDIPNSENIISEWKYALNEETLELNQSYLLGVYRASENEMAVYDLQDEKEVEQMIQDSKYVLLVKMKIEENED